MYIDDRDRENPGPNRPPARSYRKLLGDEAAGRVLPVIYGKRWLKPYMIWGEAPVPPAGWGNAWFYVDNGSGTVGWQMSACRGFYGLVALCEGVIADVVGATRDGVIIPRTDTNIGMAGAIFPGLTHAQMGVTRMPGITIHDGTQTAAWAQIPPPGTGRTDARLAYGFTACVSADWALKDGEWPDLMFQVVGGNVAADANGLCDPCEVLLDLWTNPRYGMGRSAGELDLDHGVDGATTSSYRAWIAAQGWRISATLDAQTDAQRLIEDLLLETYARPWEMPDGTIRIIPLGQLPKGGYSPPATPQALNQNDFLLGSPSDTGIIVERVQEADVYNVFPVEVSVSGAEGDASMTFEDTSLADSVGDLRRASPMSTSFITQPTHAIALSALMAQKAWRSRCQYKFKLGPRWVLLTPGDLVSLTEPTMGLAGKVAMILTTEEGADGRIQVVAQEWTGFTNPPTPSPQTPEGTTVPGTGGETWYVPPATSVDLTAIEQQLADMVADNRLTNPEKGTVIAWMHQLFDTHTDFVTKVASYINPAISTAAYDSAIASLVAYLKAPIPAAAAEATLSDGLGFPGNLAHATHAGFVAPAAADYTAWFNVGDPSPPAPAIGTIHIDGPTFRARIFDAFRELAFIQNQITDRLRTGLDNIAADNVIARGEKPYTFARYKAVLDGRAGLTSQATVNANMTTACAASLTAFHAAVWRLQNYFWHGLGCAPDTVTATEVSPYSVAIPVDSDLTTWLDAGSANGITGDTALPATWTIGGTAYADHVAFLKVFADVESTAATLKQVIANTTAGTATQAATDAASASGQAATAAANAWDTANSMAAGASAAFARAAALNRSRYGTRAQRLAATGLTNGDQWFETDYQYHPWVYNNGWQDALAGSPASGNKTYYVADMAALQALSGMAVGDLAWVSGNGNTCYRWNGANWVLVTPTTPKVSVGPAAPTSPVNGDIWCDTTGGSNLFKVWLNSAWVIQNQNKVTTSDTQPTNPSVGDIWNTVTLTGSPPRRYSRTWNGSAWVDLMAAGSIVASHLAAHSITANEIASDYVYTGTLTALQVNAVAISASSVTTGTLDCSRLTVSNLSAGSITSGNLSAQVGYYGSAMIGVLGAGHITADSIGTGVITANNMAAKSVTAVQMTVTNFDNLIPNGNSEQAAPSGGWPAGAPETQGLSSSGAYQGTRCRYAASGAATLTGPIPVSAGEQYYLEGMCRVNTSGKDCAFGVTIYDQNDAYLTDIFVHSTETTYTKKSVAITIPAGGYFMRAFISDPGWTASAAIYADNLVLRKKIDAPLVVDGAVTARGMTLTNFTNLWPNGNSEAPIPVGVDVTNLASAGAEYYRVFAAAYAGVNSRFLSQITNDRISHTIPAKDGEEFWIEAMVFGEVGSGVALYPRDNSDNSTLAASGYGDCASNQNWTRMLWQRCGYWVRCGPGTTKLILHIYNNSGGFSLIDNIFCYKRNDANLIVDGGIKANNIEANAIQTYGYSEAGGYPIVGAKLTGVGPTDIGGTKAAKVAFGSLQTGCVLAFDTGIASGGPNVVTTNKQVGITPSYTTDGSTYSMTCTFAGFTAPNAYYLVMLDYYVLRFFSGTFVRLDPTQNPLLVSPFSKTTSGFNLAWWMSGGTAPMNFANTGVYRLVATVYVFALW